jgi:hypothetical protein
VKEVAALGGNVSDVVPPLVEQRLKKRIAARKVGDSQPISAR